MTKEEVEKQFGEKINKYLKNLYLKEAVVHYKNANKLLEKYLKDKEKENEKEKEIVNNFISNFEEEIKIALISSKLKCGKEELKKERDEYYYNLRVCNFLYNTLKEQDNKEIIISNEKTTIRDFFKSVENDINNEKNNYSFDVFVKNFESKKDLSNIGYYTHIAKLTDGKAKSANGSNFGIFVHRDDSNNSDYICTSNLSDLPVDCLHNVARLKKIYSVFFLIMVNGMTVIEAVRTGSYSPFKYVDGRKTSESVLNEMLLSCCKEVENFGAHKIKQVYYPVDDDYHLLGVLNSSSIIQRVYENKKMFSKNAVIRLGGSNPINISDLNQNRYGEVTLLNSQPPIWEYKIKAPIYLNSFFYDKGLNDSIQKDLDKLNIFFCSIVKNQKSIKNPANYNRFKVIVEDMSYIIIDYLYSIYDLPKGWSNNAEIKLKLPQQVFLDIGKNKENIGISIDKNSILTSISDDFCDFVNDKLKKSNENFTPNNDYNKEIKNVFYSVINEEINIKMHFDKIKEAL